MLLRYVVAKSEETAASLDPQTRRAPRGFRCPEAGLPGRIAVTRRLDRAQDALPREGNTRPIFPPVPTTLSLDSDFNLPRGVYDD